MSSFRETIREKNVYDVLNTHRSMILSTIHLIVVLIFNNEAIQILPSMGHTYPLYSITFEVLLKHITFCQTITLFTLVMLYISPACTATKTTMRTHSVIMTASFSIKMIYAFVLVYENPTIQPIPKHIRNNHPLYSLIEMSYVIRVLATMCIVLLFAVDNFDNVIHILKKKKIKHIELFIDDSDDNSYHEV
jgi:hypothetical protein